MTEAFQKEVLKELKILRNEVDYIKEFLEDVKLTSKERKLVESRIKKIKSGNKSDFVSWKRAKKELGL